MSLAKRANKQGQVPSQLAVAGRGLRMCGAGARLADRSRLAVFARRIARITRYYPHEYPEAERRFLEPWIWENRRAGLEVVKPDVPHAVLFSGGVDHINVQPDGSVWRCILERQLELKPLGNVFDPGFELLQSPLSCAESWQCPACDRDKVHVESRCLID